MSLLKARSALVRTKSWGAGISFEPAFASIDTLQAISCRIHARTRLQTQCQLRTRLDVATLACVRSTVCARRPGRVWHDAEEVAPKVADASPVDAGLVICWGATNARLRFEARSLQLCSIKCGVVHQASDSPRYCRSLIVTGLITVGTKNSNARQLDISEHCVAQMLSFGCRMNPMQATFSCLHALTPSMARIARTPQVAC